MLQNREPDKPIQLIGRSMGVLIATQLAMQCENFVSLILAEPMIFCVLNPLEDADAIAAESQSIVGLSEDDEDGIARFISFWNGTEWNGCSYPRVRILPSSDLESRSPMMPYKFLP